MEYEKRSVDFLSRFAAIKKEKKKSHRDIVQCGRPNVMIHIQHVQIHTCEILDMCKISDRDEGFLFMAKSELRVPVLSKFSDEI